MSDLDNFNSFFAGMGITPQFIGVGLSDYSQLTLGNVDFKFNKDGQYTGYSYSFETGGGGEYGPYYESEFVARGKKE